MDRGTTARARQPVLLTTLALAFAACDGLLTVKDREFLTPATADVDLLVAGAVRDFAVAYSGDGNSSGVLATAGLFTDELISSSPAQEPDTDRRDQLPMALGNLSAGPYISLHRARRAAIRTFRALVEAGRGGGPEASLMKVLEGYTYVALGENFCSGIPFSQVDAEGNRVPGVPISTSEVFEGSITRFDEALSIDAGDDAARVGKGRALVNLGRYPEAALAVATVPTSFIMNIDHSETTREQQNPIFGRQDIGRISLSDAEGGNGLPFRSVGDPRVPWVEDPRGGFDPGIPLFLVQKYSQPGAPVVLSDGIEARLIEAEAALDSGDAAGWLATLNALRAGVTDLMAARVPGYTSLVPGPDNPTTTLDALTDPGSQAARVDLLFRERAFWMFLTGHRLGDLRRLVRQYGRSAESVFPIGAHHQGGAYGDDVALALDFAETNNPNYSVDLCDYTSP